MKAIEASTLFVHNRLSGASTIPGEDVVLFGVESRSVDLASSATLVAESLSEQTLVDGEEFQITGTGFGTKSQPEPIFFERVDDQWENGTQRDAYAGLSNGTTIPTSGDSPWQNMRTTTMKLRTTGTNYGIRTSRMGGTVDSSLQCWIQIPRIWPSPGPNQLFIRWYFRPSFDPSDHSGSHKFHRVWDTEGSTSGIRISWTQMHTVYPGPGSPSWKDWEGVVNQWNRMEIWASKSATDIHMWVNSSLRHNITDFNELSGTSGLVPRLVGIEGSGAGTFDGQSIDIADYWADDTRQRVEVGNNASFANASIREPQIATSWSSTAITFIYNRGNLPASGNLWSYVINDSGNVINTQQIRS